MSQKIMNKIFSLDTQKHLTKIRDIETLPDGKKIIFEMKGGTGQDFIFVLWLPIDTKLKKKLTIFYKDGITGYSLKNAQVFERKDVRDFENIIRCFIN